MRTINEWYDARCATASDINEHLPLLRSLASQCCHVTEFGTRSGNSTVAFLAGLELANGYFNSPCILESYDIAPAGIAPPECAAKWKFHQADTSKLETIAATDMLFIDTLHDCKQVEAELKHVPKVGSWLVFHDTVLFGWRDESTGNLPGIMQAILQFLTTEEGRKWQVWSHDVNNCGLLVLRRVKP